MFGTFRDLAFMGATGTGGGGGTWTPAEITTALWLDANDAGTITESGGFVTEWRDKSGNSRHATDPGSGLRPAYQATGFNGLPTLDFDGTDDRLGLSTEIALAQSNSFDIFVAASPDDGKNSAFIARYPGGGGSLDPAGSFRVGINTTNTLRVIHHLTAGNNTAGGLTGPGAIFVDGARLIAHYRYDSAAGSTVTSRWQMRLNGASPMTQTTGNTSSNLGTQNAIAGFNTTTTHFDGKISEIIITPSVITAADRERVEGYLAHKWGLTADLPSGHPYKTTPP